MLWPGRSADLAGIWAPPIVVYLSAIRLDKDDFVRATGLLLALGSVVLAVSYAGNGLLNAPQALLGLGLVLPALLGYSLGERLRARLDGNGFRRAVLVFFLVMGLNLLRRAVGRAVGGRVNRYAARRPFSRSRAIR